MNFPPLLNRQHVLPRFGHSDPLLKFNMYTVNMINSVKCVFDF